MTKVFVSGCYDIIHAGHIEFFKAARQHGDHLTVCMASDEVYRAWKRREPALPEDSRAAILRELRCVDEVVIGSRLPQDNAFDFVGAFYGSQAHVLASTTDDAFAYAKRAWAIEHGVLFVQITKTTRFTRVSTTEIRERLKV